MINHALYSNPSQALKHVFSSGMGMPRATFLFAGVMTLLSVALTQFVHPNFLYFTLFIGVNMMQFSVSKFCPASWAFKKLGLKSDCDNLTQQKL